MNRVSQRDSKNTNDEKKFIAFQNYVLSSGTKDTAIFDFSKYKNYFFS